MIQILLIIILTPIALGVLIEAWPIFAGLGLLGMIGVGGLLLAPYLKDIAGALIVLVSTFGVLWIISQGIGAFLENLKKPLDKIPTPKFVPEDLRGDMFIKRALCYLTCVGAPLVIMLMFTGRVTFEVWAWPLALGCGFIVGYLSATFLIGYPTPINCRVKKDSDHVGKL